MARDLISDINKSTWSKHPDYTFASYFLQRGNRTDEYLCSIPSADIESIEETEAKQIGQQLDAASDAKLLSVAIDIIAKSFPQNDCLFTYDLRGLYWTYGYCYADKVIQYHEVIPPNERRKKHKAAFPDLVFVLGRFTDASTGAVRIANQAEDRHKHMYETRGRSSFQLNDDKASPFSHHLAQKVVLQVVDSGSFCEIALKPRQVEIIYKCDTDAHGISQPQILDVPEVTTCQYKMMIHVPGLCALEQFAPHRHIKESMVDLTCQLIDKDVNKTESDLQTFEEHTSNVKLREDSIFPVRSDNRISVEDHTLMSLGFGFYLAKSKTGYASTSAYYNNRNVVIYNGFDELLESLGNQLGRAIFKAIGKTLLAPYFENEEQKRLDWADTFVIWLEVYDFSGEFKALLRVARDDSDADSEVILIQIIDPETMMDVEGSDAVDIAFDTSEYEAPHNLWNYQHYRRGGTRNRLPKREREEINEAPQVQTVTKREVVTVTISESGDDTDVPRMDLEDLSNDQGPNGYHGEEEYEEYDSLPDYPEPY